MERSRLGIVIPALNEEATIGKVVAAATAYGIVIVSNDGSTDLTAERAAIQGAHVVTSADNRGYEMALEAGFKMAEQLGCDAVVTMDADGEHSREALARFRDLLLFDGVPLVLGVRPRMQRFAETLIGLYVNWRFGVSDILCGMKGYRLDLYRVNGGFDHAKSIGSELALNSIRRGYRFVQVPVSGRPRADAPRFGNRLCGNLRILRALGRVILMPSGSRFGPRTL